MSIFTIYAEKISYSSADIIALFDQAKGWEMKYRQLMLLGKQLPELAEEYKDDRYLVKGCESQLWLHHHLDEVRDEVQDDEQLSQQPSQQIGEQRHHFAFDSDARIIKGLVIIILAAFNQLTSEQIRQFDIEAYFAELDLLKHLSPSRSNGVYAVLRAVKGLV
ncbi:MAG: cysteine desulfuration protein SufE [Phenylobacterium sp.]|jgi:cysteine desulfuration protein SufE